MPFSKGDLPFSDDNGFQLSQLSLQQTFPFSAWVVCLKNLSRWIDGLTFQRHTMCPYLFIELSPTFTRFMLISEIKIAKHIEEIFDSKFSFYLFFTFPSFPDGFIFQVKLLLIWWWIALPCKFPFRCFVFVTIYWFLITDSSTDHCSASWLSAGDLHVTVKYFYFLKFSTAKSNSSINIRAFYYL